MSKKFNEFMREVDEEAHREGPGAVAEAEAFRAYFQLAREFVMRRQALGLTQRALAGKSGVQQSEISRIEQGDANPTFQTMHALARALQSEFHLLNAGSRAMPRPRHVSAKLVSERVQPRSLTKRKTR